LNASCGTTTDCCFALRAASSRAARLIDIAYSKPGIVVWQNNGVPTGQAISHVHFQVAGTLDGGGMEFGPVDEIPVSETDEIARQLLRAI
jgi:histidine triad (HIT) family protein